MMQNKYRSPESVAAGARRWWLLLAAGALGVLVVWRSVIHQSQPDGTAPAALNATGPAGVAFAASHLPGRADGSASVPTPTAAEIVAAKVAHFARSRRALAHELARRHGVKVPGDAERFFDAIEAGDWQEIDRQFAVLSKSGRQYEDSTTPDSPRLDPVWSAVLDAYGAAEQAHLWPAQKLLDYGHAILDSLRPGMIYVGGTDNGRWIPELLNETSGDEPHVILTQNALADARYVDYLGVLYGDRLSVLNGEDSSRVGRS